MRILLVEDEENLAKAVVTGLSKKGYAVDHINDGKKAFRRITLNHTDYDLIILDLGLPEMSGEEIAKGMRAQNIKTPILVLTAKGEIDKKVDLLLAGADDYLVKPFSFNELSARIQAITRRPGEIIHTILESGDIVLKPDSHEVTKGGKPLVLTLKEFVLLEYFMKHPNVVITREELLTHLWDFNYSSFSNVVDVHVKNLRKKLGFTEGNNRIETVRGVGYRFIQQ